MAIATFNVNIEGYWRDRNKAGLPSNSGVYFVYAGSYNIQNNSVLLHSLIYIGEADDVRARVQNHEKYNMWLGYLNYGQELYFSAGSVLSINRNRVEAAYINHHKPPANTEYVNSFPFDQTTIISSGETELINTYFRVNRW